MVEAELHKDEVRALARELGLGFWDKPAAACLSSRIPYGTRSRPNASPDRALEDALHAPRLAPGARALPRQLARIEVARDELERAFAARDAITRAGKAAGFTFVTLDLAGYRMGSLNLLVT